MIVPFLFICLIKLNYFHLALFKSKSKPITHDWCTHPCSVRMGSVLKFPGECCFVIRVMGYKKARLWMRVIGIEGGAWRFPKPHYAILLFSERPAVVPHIELCPLMERWSRFLGKYLSNWQPQRYSFLIESISCADADITKRGLKGEQPFI